MERTQEIPMVEKIRFGNYMDMNFKVIPEGGIYVDPSSGYKYQRHGDKWRGTHPHATSILRRKTSYEWFKENVISEL